MQFYGQLEKASLENLGADPTAATGRIYFHTGTLFGKLYNGTTWKTLVDENTTQTITGKTIAVASNTISGTANHVAIFSAGGALTSEATLAVSRGGTNIASYTAGDLLYATGATTLAKLPIGTNGFNLQVSAGLPAWVAPSSLAVATKSANYTLTSSDDVILVNTSGGDITLTLPAAASNTGKVFYFKGISGATSFNAGIIDGNASEIDGDTTKVMRTHGEVVIIVSDGANWRVVEHRTETPMLSFTPTGGWTTNTTYTGKWARAGQWLKIWVRVALSGAPTGTLTIAIPFSLSIDTALLPGTADGQSPHVGRVMAIDAGTEAYWLDLTYLDSTSVRPRTMAASLVTGKITGNGVDATTPFTFGSGDSVELIFEVPISGWWE